jgi:hypothetical protein
MEGPFKLHLHEAPERRVDAVSICLDPAAGGERRASSARCAFHARPPAIFSLRGVQVHLDSRSIYQLQGAWTGVAELAGFGEGVWALRSEETREEVLDRVRFFAEECDSLQVSMALWWSWDLERVGFFFWGGGRLIRGGVVCAWVLTFWSFWWLTLGSFCHRRGCPPPSPSHSPFPCAPNTSPSIESFPLEGCHVSIRLRRCP